MCLSRTLRYYEEIGLMQPDSINEHNGYRYYSAESMYRVQMIRYLGDEGFTLEEIGEILREEDLVRLREIFAEKIEKTRATIDYYRRREESLARLVCGRGVGAAPRRPVAHGEIYPPGSLSLL